MTSLLFAFNATAPIAIMMAIGYILRRVGFMNAEFAKMSNKLVFRIFLPAMLFLNIYKINSVTGITLGYIAYAIILVLIVFCIALGVIIVFTKDNSKRGALLQSTFRSNYALIGIPLASALFGDAGVAVAALLSAFCIPCFNVLAVISLSAFDDRHKKEKWTAQVRSVLLGIARNPLIISVLLGVAALLVRYAFINADIGWRLSDVKVIYKVLEYLSDIATPIALITLGAQFEFSRIKSLRRYIIFGTVARVVVVPLIGIGTALLLFRDTFGGAHFAAFVALFATPVAVSSVPMAQEMGADVELAGQLVVWSTIFSSFTIFIVSLVLKQLGVL